MKAMKFLLISLAALILSGCPSTTSQQNAAKASQVASASVVAAQQGEITIYNTGQQCLAAAQSPAQQSACIVITPDEHQFLQREFLAISELGKTLDSCILGSTTTPGIVACANTALVTVNQINADGALALKSDKAKTTFQLVITSVQVGIETIQALLGGS